MTTEIHIPSALPSLSMLICESEDGPYIPIAVVGSISEAQELADEHYRDCASDPDNSPICPYCYAVWGRDELGEFTRYATLTV